MSNNISPEAAADREANRDQRGRFGHSARAEADVDVLDHHDSEDLAEPQQLADRLVRDLRLQPDAVTVNEDSVVIAPPGGRPSAYDVEIAVRGRHVDGSVELEASMVTVSPPDENNARWDDEQHLVTTTDPAELVTTIDEEIGRLDDDGYGNSGPFDVSLPAEEAEPGEPYVSPWGATVTPGARSPEPAWSIRGSRQAPDLGEPPF